MATHNTKDNPERSMVNTQIGANVKDTPTRVTLKTNEHGCLAEDSCGRVCYVIRSCVLMMQDQQEEFDSTRNTNKARLQMEPKSNKIAIQAAA